jgi:hypothetical protein
MNDYIAISIQNTLRIYLEHLTLSQQCDIPNCMMIIINNDFF